MIMPNESPPVNPLRNAVAEYLEWRATRLNVALVLMDNGVRALTAVLLAKQIENLYRGATYAQVARSTGTGPRRLSPEELRDIAVNPDPRDG